MNMIKQLNLFFFGIVVIVAVICSGGNEKGKDTPKICAPFAINSSGDLLFCVVKSNSTSQPCIVPLKNISSHPIALTFQGSDSCFGAEWGIGINHDELLFITGRGETNLQAIKSFKFIDNKPLEIFSYTVDKNLMLIILYQGFYDPNVLAFRVEKKGEGSYLGLSKDKGRNISVSKISAPAYLLWIDQYRFYVAHDMKDGRMVMSRVQLDINSMTLHKEEILTADEIILATKSLNGSLVYAVGAKLFQDSEILAVLPEEVGMRPFIDGRYLACVSRDHKKIFILSDKGDVLDIKQKSRESMFVGLSATNRCIYLTTKDRDKILSYDFIKRREKVVFDSRVVN